MGPNPIPSDDSNFYINKMGTIESLKQFIDAAEKSRKYPPNTATSKRTALNLFEKELSNEEQESIEIFSNNLEKIAQEVYRKNSSTMSVSSIDTYRRRIGSLLHDFEKYGTDSSKMSSWNPRSRNIKKKIVKEISNVNNTNNITVDTPAFETHRLEVSIRPGIKSILIIPADLTKDEAQRISNIINSFAIQKD